jgi:flavin-binding protein dodecin
MSVYKVVELVGTSEKSWEDAARNAINVAGKTLRNLRVAEITELDLKIEDGKFAAYRSKVKLSFKVEDN